MNLRDELRNTNKLKFSFGKNTDYQQQFNNYIRACSMNQPGYGLGISPELSAENQIRGVFNIISKEKGIFVFNVNGVNLLKAGEGFQDFEEAINNGQITEWELSLIIEREDYLKKTIFHNYEIIFNKINNGLKILWK